MDGKAGAFCVERRWQALSGWKIQIYTADGTAGRKDRPIVKNRMGAENNASIKRTRGDLFHGTEDRKGRKMYKALALDLDGTLLQTAEISRRAANHVLETHGFRQIDRKRFDEICHSGAEYLMKEAAQIEEGALSKQLLEEYVETYKRNFEAPPYENAIEICRELKQKGRKLTVYSNKVMTIVKRQLKASGLDKILDLVVADDGSVPLKPDPEGLYHIADLFGVRVSEILMVGDSQNDVDTAENAGADSCFFRMGIGKLEEGKRKPTYEIDKLDELREIVLREG